VEVQLERVQSDVPRPLLHGELAVGFNVCLSVSDSRRGMSGEVLQRAFDCFLPTKKVGEGTGVGL
jgi:C4-dicarboxylate-specific signal transduction histidine kinase